MRLTRKKPIRQIADMSVAELHDKLAQTEADIVRNMAKLSTCRPSLRGTVENLIEIYTETKVLIESKLKKAAEFSQLGRP